MECYEEVVDRMSRGGSIDDVEQLIDGDVGSQDEKAALWLYAWSLQSSRKARHEARQMLLMAAARRGGPIHGTD